MRWFKKRLRESLIIIALSLALLGLIELVLRLIYPVHPELLEQYEAESLAYEFNEHYLLALKPNARQAFPRQQADGGELIHWQSNSDGFRGPELRAERDFRIMVYGDSNIQARFSSLENTLPYQLEKKLSARSGKNIEVINAGLLGFGPDQSLIRMGLDFERYRPDIVVLHIFADNDFGDLIRNRLFDLDARDQLIASTHQRVIDPVLLQLQNSYEASTWLSRSRLAWAVKSLSELTAEMQQQDPQAIIDGYLDACETEYAPYKNKQPPTVSIFFDHYEYDLALFPEKDSSLAKTKLMDRVLRKAQQLADSADFKLIVLIQPSKNDLSTDIVPNYQHFSGFDAYQRQYLSRLVVQSCTENNIRCVDLFDSFLRNGPEKLYLRGAENHWSDAGQALAAQHLTDYMQAHADALGLR